MSAAARLFRNRSGFLLAALIAGTAGPVLAPVATILSAATAMAKTPLKKKPAAPAPAAEPKAASGPTSILPGAGSKEPINIDAGKLDYFDKEQKLVYSGDVVAVQGESTLKASVLTIFLQKNDPAAVAGAPAPQASPLGAPTSGSQVKHMEAEGPVTLISKDQIGTGDHAVYDKDKNKVYLSGNVTLTQGTNVTQGDRLIYDMTSGLAQVFSGQSNNGRVTSIFTPGNNGPDPAAGGGGNTDKAAQDKSASPKRKPNPGPKSASTTAPHDADAQ